MDNNDILRRLRYILNLSDDAMIDMYKKGGAPVTRAEISDYLKKEDHPDFEEVVDVNLATFLNGVIVNYRGKKDGETPIAEEQLDNNTILRKLKIAFNFKSDEIVYLIKLGGQQITETELSAFFRRSNHAKFKYCNDQYLRTFLKGFQIQRDKQRKAEARKKTS